MTSEVANHVKRCGLHMNMLTTGRFNGTRNLVYKAQAADKALSNRLIGFLVEPYVRLCSIRCPCHVQARYAALDGGNWRESCQASEGDIVFI